jgi:hypothetical protein
MFFFLFLPFPQAKDRKGNQLPPAVKSFIHQISAVMAADFRSLPKTISLARSVRHVSTRRCNVRSFKGMNAWAGAVATGAMG